MDYDETRVMFPIEEITQKLEQGLGDFMNSEKFKDYLNTMSKFHHYSVNNTILIAMQRPDATLVAGYEAWQKNFDRHVKRGSKGIKIISPVKVKKKVWQGNDFDRDDNGEKCLFQRPGETKEQFEKRSAETVKEVEYTNFMITSVFDVSDTEGKELPAIGVSELNGTVEDYPKLITALESISKVPIEYADITTGAKGYFSTTDHKIVVQKDMSEVQTLKTLIHEMAHSLLHDKTEEASHGQQDTKSKSTKEVEAESVAYTVCQHFGIDTSDYSFGYIASWSQGKDLKALKASMDTIRKTASTIISDVNTKVMEEKTMATLDEAAAQNKTDGQIRIYGPSTPKEEPKQDIEKPRDIQGLKKSILDKLKGNKETVASHDRPERRSDRSSGMAI